MNNIITFNSKPFEIPNLSGLPDNHCLICKETKTIDDFHTISVFIDDLFYKKQQINHICKNCLKTEGVIVKTEPLIDKESFRNLFLNNQRQKIEQNNNINLDDYLKTPEVEKILNLKDKNEIKRKTKIGILNPIKFYYNPFDLLEKRSPKFTFLYNKQEVDMAKWMKENGRCIPRGKISKEKAIKEFTPHLPYFIKSPEGKEYFFDNRVEQKRCCGFCLEIKDYTDFHQKKSNQCKNCANKRATKNYQKKTPTEKIVYLNKVKQYRRDNIEKFRSWKKIRNKLPVYKLKRSIRSRVRKIIRKIQMSAQVEIDLKLVKTQLKTTGCSLPELKSHIESKFQKDMTWENHGPGYELNYLGCPILDETGNIIKKKQWHLDHIRPIDDFDILNPEERTKINHYTNLQPLWSEDNLNKSHKLVWDTNNSKGQKELYLEAEAQKLLQDQEFQNNIIQ